MKTDDLWPDDSPGDTNVAGDLLLQFRRDGDRLLLQTSRRALERSRRRVRAAGATVLVAGLVLTPWAGWAWLPLLLIAAALSLFLLLWAPGFVRTTTFVAVDDARGRLIPVGRAAREGRPVPLDRITAIRGAHEVHGWDPRIAVYAVLDDGSEIPALIAPGSDERFAQQACRALGRLLGCPATCAGPFGMVSDCCYRPALSRDPAERQQQGTASPPVGGGSRASLPL
jgi:hypothetical protein